MYSIQYIILFNKKMNMMMITRALKTKKLYDYTTKVLEIMLIPNKFEIKKPIPKI